MTRLPSPGFPVHRKLEERFGDSDDVVPFHLQTVFEGHSTNTAARGPKEARKHGIDSAVGYDAHVDGIPLSTFMLRYGTGGTPWSIVIDKAGIVRYSNFTPDDPDTLARIIDNLGGD